MTNKSADSSKKAPRGKAFPKGKSGNPGGRPKLPEDVKHVRELARQYTAQAIDALVDVMAEGSGPARVAASNALLDRGWGKPEQAIIGPGEDGAHLFTMIERRIVKAQ
jgi:hypothetical protein